MLSLHRVAAAVRRTLARRPWIRWSFILVVALGVGLLVESRLRAVESAGAEWGRRVDVVIASRTLAAGTTLGAADLVVEQWPASIAPPSRLGTLPLGVTLQVAVASGDPLRTADISPEPDDRRVLVPSSDWPSLRIGDRVDVVLLGAALLDNPESPGSDSEVLHSGSSVTAVFDRAVEIAAPRSVIGRITQGVADQRVVLAAWTTDG